MSLVSIVIISYLHTPGEGLHRPLYQCASLCRARLQYGETVNQLETQAECVAWLVPGVPLSEVVRSPPARRGPPGRWRQCVQAVPRHHTASHESAPASAARVSDHAEKPLATQME